MSIGNISGNLRKPILIFGCQRSGTTLLTTILGAHPDILAHPSEPQFLLNIYHRFGRRIRNVEPAVNYLAQHPFLPKFITATDLDNAFKGCDEISFSNFCQRYLQIWAKDRLEQRYPVLKDPYWIYHLDLIYQCFPNAFFIHLIRDPRANINSQLARWSHYSAFEATMMWYKAVLNMKHWQEKRPAQIHELTYEQLITNPKETLQALCEFINIQYTDQMLSFQLETKQFTAGKPPKKVLYRALNSDRLNRWQTQLTPMEIQLIEYTCQDLMQRWQYKPIYPDVSKASFFGQYLQERVYYLLKKTGRFLKASGRQIIWRFRYRYF